MGLLDQRLALEFVRSNIAAFGDDLARIALWEQSAGALSVDRYNFAYPEDPIVSGLIMDSGTALYPSVTLDPTHSNFTFVAAQLLCKDLSPTAELACMRNVSSVAIETLIQAYEDNGTQPVLSFNPMTDNRTKFSNYTARYLTRNFSMLVCLFLLMLDGTTVLMNGKARDHRDEHQRRSGSSSLRPQQSQWSQQNRGG